jgi:uncharacterized membrane protein YkvI
VVPLRGSGQLTSFESVLASSPAEIIKERTMKNPLESIWGTIISGLVLTALLYWAALALLH